MMVMFSSDAEPATGWNAGHTLRHPAAATVQVEPVAVSLVKKYSVMCDDGFTHAVLPETASESGRFPAAAGYGKSCYEKQHSQSLFHTLQDPPRSDDTTAQR